MGKRLAAVWAALLIGIHVAFGPILHRWRTRCGATEDETDQQFLGDELVPAPTWSYTHAITTGSTGPSNIARRLSTAAGLAVVAVPVNGRAAFYAKWGWLALHRVHHDGSSSEQRERDQRHHDYRLHG